MVKICKDKQNIHSSLKPLKSDETPSLHVMWGIIKNARVSAEMWAAQIDLDRTKAILWPFNEIILSHADAS